MVCNKLIKRQSPLFRIRYISASDLFPEGDGNVMLWAGLLTLLLLLSGLPDRVWRSVALVSEGAIGAYSCGNSSGSAPDSHFNLVHLF